VSPREDVATIQSQTLDRNSTMVIRLLSIVMTFAFVALLATTISAQTTGFTYQGRLADSGTPVNGNYDLQFALWNSLSGGAQVGSTQTNNSVVVSNGVFTTNLDFGANAFPGGNRFLEISVRPAGVGSFTTLTPRQPITSTPYAVRSLNAATADSVLASGIPSGSGNYIQNTTTPQPSTNFNVSGNGTVGGVLTGNIVNSTTQYNLNGSRILGNLGTDNLFIGIGAGVANTAGERNTLIGNNAGLSLAGQSDSDNTFIGSGAGRLSTGTAQNVFVGAFAGLKSQGGSNAFVGFASGSSNTTGTNNAFFGNRSGDSNSSGSANAMVGDQVGLNNSSGSDNVFFGFGAGSSNNSGSNNTFIGRSSGFKNTVGTQNTILGSVATVGVNNLTNATAIGANAEVDVSNAIVLGSINGVNGATADTNVGIGTTSPSAKLSIVATGDGARLLLLGTERAWVFRQFGTGAATALELTGADANNNNKNFLINTQGNVGIGTQGPLDKLHVIGDIRVGVFGTNGCLKNNNGGTIVGTCSSDVRFKRNLVAFGPTLDQLTRLQPRYFFWRASEFPEKNFGSAREAGLIAQEVEQVLPELVSQDSEGFKQVDYSKLPLMLLQAMKEQQVQIQKQSELIEAQRVLAVRQQRQIAALKRAVANRPSRRH